MEHNNEGAYWRQRFHALSDQSDSTIKLLKKDNQRLRVKVEELEDQSHAQTEQAKPITFIKAEPLEEDMLTEIPQTPSISGRLR